MFLFVIDHLDDNGPELRASVEHNTWDFLQIIDFRRNYDSQLNSFSEGNIVEKSR